MQSEIVNMIESREEMTDLSARMKHNKVGYIQINNESLKKQPNSLQHPDAWTAIIDYNMNKLIIILFCENHTCRKEEFLKKKKLKDDHSLACLGGAVLEYLLS